MSATERGEPRGSTTVVCFDDKSIGRLKAATVGHELLPWQEVGLSQMMANRASL